ncbi:MAG: tetratricopeptide repeat protein [Calditrichia bacterium]|nr:tetratricopeptide repeat protein [Calditrichia bacterium]
MLKAKKKFSKKELKEDQFIMATIQAKSFVEKNATKIAGGVVAVIAILVLGYFWTQSKKNAEETATTMLTQAQFELQNNQRDVAIATYTSIMDEYSGTNGAALATFQLAKLYWSDNNLELAKSYFKSFLDDYGDNTILLQAGHAGYADCMLAEKNYDEAASHYEKAAGISPDFPQAIAYLYSAAQAYKEAGNTGKARSLAERVVAQSEDNQQIKNRAEVLLKSLAM